MTRNLLSYWLIFTTLLLSTLLAPSLPPIPLSSELNGILSASKIELPSFSPLIGNAKEVKQAAHELITQTQKARIAIASHVLSASHPAEAPSAVKHARKLQDEFMDHVQQHLNSQLDQVRKSGGKVEDLEWELHRGFATGVVESKPPAFTQSVLKPEKTTTDKGRMEKVKAALENLNPVAAIRRFRIRRVLRKMSSTPASPSIPPTENPIPRNVDQLRATLSSMTALRSIQSSSAAADAKDAAAAQKIESTLPIQSNVVLEEPLKKPAKMVKNKKKVEPWDEIWIGGKWTSTYNQRNRVDDWSDIPIPGMA
ncbi:hypothetical protein NDA11_001576 [Ustilago hordei]|uniref:Uncharacterized protein n=1 Tax=Ustilago hordei TaxID=120017 RepID=I2FRI7_USTHO|nr:uncharacterized protein UHO2_05688 [Ustilago hordei]KAJ1042829.1 hypothetical protein NDA10_007992 [Ustilago hordei]KAJ1572760.1 hypothetical protein NDA15_003087 [Ustilago hordei]KAJ1575161.1 hypothetical protein NDA11_001576 [Ustilago hordei]KAJ1575774.1 hypothetical protein NDA12_005157 [Ustilago hordei]CCF49530.1 uncharacterized protein UHOR_07519 [Ustilago hordei]